MRVTLIFPHQLFENHPALQKGNTVFLIEDELFFSQYKFHRQKLVLHRASMKYYEDLLIKKGYSVSYFNYQPETLQQVFNTLKSSNCKAIDICDPVDYLLSRRIKRLARQYSIELTILPSPNFLNSSETFKASTGNRRKYLMANFYMAQRKTLNILMENDGTPVGGKWSFDTDNRKRLPKNTAIPVFQIPKKTNYLTEAISYIDTNFPDNPGSVKTFYYPVTHQQANENLDNFLIHRMHNFGVYEDALARDEHFLFHAVLTPALNIGLLSPQQIIDRTLELHTTHHFPLNSLEGFIRQIIGWREFMKGVYEHEGVFLRKNNFFQFNKRIPESFYNGTTGIEPIDFTIKKILNTGYCHHIERLMILGNFMQLCEFDPDNVYRWFMELFIDSYDWVMVPNVYGMSQYADGGLITTKPYVSGSNYVLNMSDYKKGAWCAVWDALYWRYLFKNKNHFINNPRMTMMLRLLEKMDKQKLNNHLTTAENFLAAL